mgnify:CR=1 FL=1
MRVCCPPDIEKESVKIFEKDYHALRSAQIFLQIFFVFVLFRRIFVSFNKGIPLTKVTVCFIIRNE